MVYVFWLLFSFYHHFQLVKGQQSGGAGAAAPPPPSPLGFYRPVIICKDCCKEIEYVGYCIAVRAQKKLVCSLNFVPKSLFK